MIRFPNGLADIFRITIILTMVHLMSIITSPAHSQSVNEKEKIESAKKMFDLGISHFSNNRFEDAISHFRKSIQMRQDYAEAHHYLGLAYFYTNKKSMAIEQYEILRSLDVQLANKLYNVIYK
jgi:Tfp pilus assembly protein PilF